MWLVLRLHCPFLMFKAFMNLCWESLFSVWHSEDLRECPLSSHLGYEWASSIFWRIWHPTLVVLSFGLWECYLLGGTNHLLDADWMQPRCRRVFIKLNTRGHYRTLCRVWFLFDLEGWQPLISNLVSSPQKCMVEHIRCALCWQVVFQAQGAGTLAGSVMEAADEL